LRRPKSLLNEIPYFPLCPVILDHVPVPENDQKVDRLATRSVVRKLKKSVLISDLSKNPTLRRASDGVWWLHSRDYPGLILINSRKSAKMLSARLHGSKSSTLRSPPYVPPIPLSSLYPYPCVTASSFSHASSSFVSAFYRIRYAHFGGAVRATSCGSAGSTGLRLLLMLGGAIRGPGETSKTISVSVRRDASGCPNAVSL
jgi:hypothetical protein